MARKIGDRYITVRVTKGSGGPILEPIESRAREIGSGLRTQQLTIMRLSGKLDEILLTLRACSVQMEIVRARMRETENVLASCAGVHKAAIAHARAVLNK